MATLTAPPSQLSQFVNEQYADFSQPEIAERATAALAKVRSEFGKEYDLLIAGDRRRSTAKLNSVNPANPSEVIGVHQKGSEDDAREAIETAAAYFPTWAAVPMEDRVRMLVRAANILRERKFEFDAWLVYEAGKPWLSRNAACGLQNFGGTTSSRTGDCQSRLASIPRHHEMGGVRTDRRQLRRTVSSRWSGNEPNRKRK